MKKIITIILLTASLFSQGNDRLGTYISTWYGGMLMGTAGTAISTPQWIQDGRGNLSPFALDFTKGRVGIGILNPYTKLHINGDMGFFPREQQTLVTFVFDDANDSDINVMKPLFDAQGEVACSAIKISNVGTGSHLTIANLVTLENAGWEMLSHTVNHPDMTTISDDSIRSELSYSRDSLETWGLTVNNFAYPGGDNNETVRRITSEFYRSARGISGNINEQILTTYNLRTENIDDHTGLAGWKVFVDSAESQLKWLIFYLHDTDTDDSTAIAELIDYIQAKSISIVTVNQGLDLVGNMLNVGDNFAVGEQGIRADGVLTVNGNYVIVGNATGSGITRTTRFNVTPGGTPNTNINITATAVYNSPTITNATNLIDTGTSGSFSLFTNEIVMDITETIIAVSSVHIEYQDLNSSDGLPWTIRARASSEDMKINFYTSGNQAAQTILSIFDAGDAIQFRVTYYTSD